MTVSLQLFWLGTTELAVSCDLFFFALSFLPFMFFYYSHCNRVVPPLAFLVALSFGF